VFNNQTWSSSAFNPFYFLRRPFSRESITATVFISSLSKYQFPISYSPPFYQSYPFGFLRAQLRLLKSDLPRPSSFGPPRLPDSSLEAPNEHRSAESTTCNKNIGSVSICLRVDFLAAWWLCFVLPRCEQDRWSCTKYY